MSYGGTIHSVKQDKKDGESVYVVELKESNQGDINVDVGLYSGEIVDMQNASNFRCQKPETLITPFQMA